MDPSRIDHTLVRHPIAPVVTVPKSWPALEPVTVRHAGPRVAQMFAALKREPEPTLETPRVEVHVVKMRRRR